MRGIAKGCCMTPTASDSAGLARLACMAAGVLACLVAVGFTATGPTTLRIGMSQPFSPVADVVVGIAAGAADAAAASAAVAGPDLSRRIEPAASRAEGVAPEPAAPQVFAVAEGISLVEPSPELLAIGFHEAYGASSLAWEPRGTPFTNRNAPRYAAPPPADGPDYAILSTRRRSTPATSAIDIAVPQNAPLVSPVTGTVAYANPYLLYGRYHDTIVTIIPEGRPDLRLVMVHLNGVRVSPGQPVVAGETPLAATAMLFPFRSQIDEFSGRHPHLHIELRRA